MPGYELSWIYVLVFFLGGVGFVAMLLTMSRMIAPSKRTPEKLRPYESGEEPVMDAWGRYPTHFYLYALLFVVFDVEAIFLFLWAVVFRDLGWFGLLEIGIFLALLVVGLVYEWKKGALSWY
ncbi:MAG: NADH-quinone oxidoreductase subunit A [Elusimicrobia bacterium]|nr:NADH-quinone oxidoreductase subunit A [Elusimicrobiota bacterium]